MYRYTFNSSRPGSGEEAVYGEHVKGCTIKFEGNPSWSWEWQDTRLLHLDKCWTCGEPVPEGVVAIVALMNWKEIAKSEKV